MTDVLLSTKLALPPLRRGMLPRPHLLARLDESLRQACALTLVSAPAGFGKTTLLSEWARQSGRLAAWIALDEGDNDTARFLAYLVAALQQLDPTLGAGLLETRQAASTPGLPHWLTPLINQIGASSRRFILILDDFHLITAPLVQQAVEFLLDHLPENLHVVIATRADPHRVGHRSAARARAVG